MIGKRFLLVLPLLFLLALPGCSLFRAEPTPLVKNAIVNVADSYLRSIALAQLNQVESMIFWYAYSESKNNSISKDNVRDVIVALKDRWTPEEHPLTKLVVQDVWVKGDHAGIELLRDGNPNNFLIGIKFVWAGAGWLIETDNLFGVDGYLTQLAKEAPPPKTKSGAKTK